VVKRALMLLLALVSLAAQQPPDESNLPDSEKRIPIGHYCKRSDVPIGPRETKAHPCDCKYSCSVDENGVVTERESSSCLAYCHKNGRRCTCHPEGDPSVTCTTGNGLIDMDGQVVAVRLR
jgi:hypothetical protein